MIFFHPYLHFLKQALNPLSQILDEAFMSNLVSRIYEEERPWKRICRSRDPRFIIRASVIKAYSGLDYTIAHLSWSKC